MKQLKNLITLSQNVKIYIPSTVNVNQSIDNEYIVNECLKILSSFFGGATSYLAHGAWVTTSGSLIQEKVTICQSFCNELALNENIEKIYNYCLDLKGELKQESIALEVNNVLHLV